MEDYLAGFPGSKAWRFVLPLNLTEGVSSRPTVLDLVVKEGKQATHIQITQEFIYNRLQYNVNGLLFN